VKEAVASLIAVARLRWISWSHFESDECGALNDWLAVAPNAEAVCSKLGALVNINDFATRPARGFSPDDVFSTGRYRFRYHPTPHLPHGWDAGVLFEETQQTLLCSDLFHQNGELEPLTHDDVVARTRASLREYQTGLLADYQPPTPHTERMLESLAALNPRTLAIMHGSSFAGDGAQALRELGKVLRETFEEK
jgi:flavorubredoxin